MRNKSSALLDLLFVIAGIGILFLFTVRYQMAFRLDDVLHIQWARTHTFFEAWDPIHGQIVRSFRPIFAATIWILTHTAGTDNYFPWHITLVGSFLIGLAYAGLTARYISGRSSALYFTTAIYWIAFLPILNVLFWYGDLTYTIELLFITPAWYYGLRGLFEGNLRLAAIGISSGILAVMAKEPAIVLVHGVLLGATAVRFKEVRKVWQQKKTGDIATLLVLYALFFGVTIFIYFASPTRANRFFSLDTPSSELWSAIRDRQSYYNSILLGWLPRILLFAPIFFLGRFRPTATGQRRSVYWIRLIFFVVLDAVALVLAGSGINSLAIILILALAAKLVLQPADRRAALLQLPFAICAIITLAALSITIMIVKTQLTECAILILVMSGCAWSLIAEDLREAVAPLLRRTSVRRLGFALCILALASIATELYPKLSNQERLLRAVRDVRGNVNDAIKWVAANLPPNSTLLMPNYGLHGLHRIDDLSQSDDQTKIGAQYVFHGGYVKTYLELLGRPDIDSIYLGDPSRVRAILDSARQLNAGYLFLQSELDYNRFHGLDGKPGLLKDNDTLLKAFAVGGYHSELWRLR